VPLFKPLPAQKKAQYVAQQILEALEAGRLRAGERLPPERELAAMFNVSRSSVREAMTMLQIAGVLDVRHGSGTFVRAMPDPHLLYQTLRTDLAGGDEFLDLTVARHAFETGILPLAAEEREAEGLQEMTGALERMEAAAQARDIRGFLDANVQFHIGLARATGNRTLTAVAGQLHGLLTTPGMLQTREVFYRQEFQRLERALALHRDLYVGVAAGDEARAGEALHRHYVNVAAPLIQRSGGNQRGGGAGPAPGAKGPCAGPPD